MRKSILSLAVAATALTGLSACGDMGGSDPGYASDNQYRQYRRYDYNRPDPAYNGYYADRYYRDGPNYRERRLSRNERVYRGENGQYYCRRSDGTTGLIVGGLAGGVLGNAIAPGGSKTLGTILGAIAGGAGGAAIDSSSARCR
ncbi:MAG: glycine zipper 2TM domain-containing protein [Sphingomonadales bacterium]